MRKSSLFSLFLAGSLLVSAAAAPAFAETKTTTKSKVKTKTKSKATAKKPATPAVKKAPVVTAEKKKKLAELYAGFKFGMSKDEVVGVFSKQIDEKYDEKLKSTTDVSAQDRLRKQRKADVQRIAGSYLTFEGKRTGWDVSIIEDEFRHKTGESMLEVWENKDGKNQRRFFFFHEAKLYKMFVSLDVSILPEDKKNFETFQGVMLGQYGPGLIEGGVITWSTPEFEVRAVDKLKTYDALGLIIEDTKVKKDLVAIREANAPKKAETNSIIKAVIDTDGTDAPDTKSNSNAVDAVINAQGGGKKK